MKKLILLPFLMVSLSLFAQIPAATGFVGGSLQFSSENNSNGSPAQTSTSTQFTAVPNLGVIVCNNLELGVLFSYSTHNVTYSTENGKESDNTFMVGPYLNYYHPIKSNSSFYWMFGFNATYGEDNGQSEVNGQISPNGITKEYFAGITPGIAWNPAKHFLFKLSYGELSYMSVSNSTNIETTNTFAFNLTPSTLQFGVDYIFSFKGK